MVFSFMNSRDKMADRDQGFRKIIVKNYPADTEDRDLQIMFEKYGKIEDRKLCSSFLFSRAFVW